jgi:integrase/recombinase XerD
MVILVLGNINMVTIKSYLEKMKANGRSSTTISSTRMVLNALDRFKPIEKCTEIDLVNYFETFNGKESSKNLHKMIIKKYFRDIGKDDIIKWIKYAKVDFSKKEDDILNTDDTNKLIHHAPSGYFKALIAFLYESGARIGEAKSLKYGDFKQTTDGFIVSIPTLKTKNGYRKLILPMSTQYIANLKVETCADDNDIVFGYTVLHERKTLEKIGKKAGIEKPVHPHAFRHARATEDARCGYNEQLLKKKFGWSKGSKMVDRYVDLSDDDVQNAELTGINSQKIKTKKPELIDQAKPISVDQAYNKLFELEERNEELEKVVNSIIIALNEGKSPSGLFIDKKNKKVFLK